MAQLSLALFRSRGALPCHLLISLRSRLRKEDIDSALSSEQLAQMKNDVIALMKATGELPPVLTADTSILNLLVGHAATTDRERLSPGEARIWDLGLLRDKVRYHRPALKAEKILAAAMSAQPVATTESSATEMDTSDNASDAQQADTGIDTDPQTAVQEEATNIPNIPKGTATLDEYKQGLLAANAIALCFEQQEHLAKLYPAEHAAKVDENGKPIGFRLLSMRARPLDSETREIADFRAEYRQVKQVSDQVDWALCNATKQRGWKKQTFGNEASCDDKENSENARAISVRGKRPLTEGTPDDPNGSREAEKPKKKARRYCCMKGCNNTDKNYDGRIQRVPPYPPTIPPDATKQRKTTFRRKQFVRRERTDRLGIGRSFADDIPNLRICGAHEMETVKGKSVKVPTSDGDTDTKCEQIDPFDAPVGLGAKSFGTPAETKSNGNGTERELVRHVIDVSIREARLQKGTRLALAREGMQREDGSASSGTSAKNDIPSKWIPKISLESLSPSEVHRRTGFQDLKHLLSYSAIRYGGDLEKMTKTATFILQRLVVVTTARGFGQSCTHITRIASRRNTRSTCRWQELIIGSIVACQSASLAMSAGMSVGRSPFLRVDNRTLKSEDRQTIEDFKRRKMLEERNALFKSVCNCDHAMLAAAFLNWDANRSDAADQKKYCEKRDIKQLVKQLDSSLASLGYVATADTDRNDKPWRIVRARANAALAPSQLVRVLDQ